MDFFYPLLPCLSATFIPSVRKSAAFHDPTPPSAQTSYMEAPEPIETAFLHKPSSSSSRARSQGLTLHMQMVRGRFLPHSLSQH